MFFISIVNNNKIESKKLSKLNDCKVFVTIEKFYPKRSLKSNRYYWALLNQTLQVVADHLGYDNKEELHKDFKDKFLSYKSINKLTGEEVSKTKSTTELNSNEFTEYVEKVLKYCAESFGIALQTPEEFYEN